MCAVLNGLKCAVINGKYEVLNDAHTECTFSIIGIILKAGG